MCQKCIIWGSGNYGERLSQLVTKETNYRIVAYCDMDLEKVGQKIGEYEIVSIEQAINLCCNEKLTVLIGVFDFNAVRYIKSIIKSTFPDDVNVVVGHEIQNDVENKKIREYHRNIVFDWKIDFEKNFKIWIDNIRSEVEYWIREIADTRGRNHEYYISCRKNNAFIHEYISSKLKGNEVIMDIGCGLVSRYGTQLKDGNTIKLIPVDALAHFYNCINDKITDGLKQDYSCYFGMFEFLGDIFEKDYADYIIINNALDHCIDPWKSLVGCIYVLKQGGRMYLSHRRAEAVYEDWVGLHRWNIDCKDGNFFIWNKENAVNITEKLSQYADVYIRYDDTEDKRIDQILDIEIVKKNELRLEDFFDIQEEKRTLVWCIDKLMKSLASDSKTFYNMLEQVQL